MKRVLIFFMFFLFFKMTFAQVVYSPDKHLKLSFVLKEGGKPVYELNYKDKKVIEESKMGFILNDFLSFSENFSVIGTENTSSDTIWKPVWGENSEIRDNYNEMLLFLVHKATNWKVNIRF
ncbi:hypothetical protein CAPN004_08600 [Capnocytophaga cynodegmi]|nr:hypothetical protein CAPN004_08600 [Capnocytophaga cynodegmi]